MAERHTGGRDIAVSGFQLKGRVSRLQTLTTVYTDATNRMTFGALTTAQGRTVYPCHLEIFNVNDTNSAYYIVNSDRATSGVAASATAGSVTFTATDSTTGTSGNLILIACLISGTSTTANVVATTGAGGTTTYTFYSETGGGDTALSTSAEFQAAIVAAAAGTLTGADGTSTVVTTVTATALAGGIDKDSQTARLTAIGTAATGTAGYRELLPKESLRIVDDGSDGGIRDVIFVPAASGVIVAASSAYPAEL